MSMIEYAVVAVGSLICLGLWAAWQRLRTWYFNQGRDEAVDATKLFVARYKDLSDAEPDPNLAGYWLSFAEVRATVLAEYKLKVAWLLWRIEHLDTHRPLDLDRPERGLGWQEIKEQALQGRCLLEWLLVYTILPRSDPRGSNQRH
jgi:hypothetical protein